MTKSYDAIIIGGGIIGTATGYYLSKQGLTVLLLEKDYLTAGSTGRCITGIRQQFSTPATIKTAMRSVALFSRMEEELGRDVEWTNSGYIFLAHDEQKVETFKKTVALQKQFGLDVDYLSAEECKKIVPMLNIDGLLGGTWCPSDGQASPFFVVQAYAENMVKNGCEIIRGDEVTGITVKSGRVESVTTASGAVYGAPMIVNAAGPWAREVGRMAGVELEVEPERHEALITEGVAYMNIPMLVDYRKEGGYFVQRTTGQFIGCYTPEHQVKGRDTGSTLEFIAEMARRMCRLIPALEDVAILRQWSGSYSMTPDGSPIVDETSVAGFFCSVGMSGHGFMLGPALGESLAGYMVNKTWPFDMSEFAFGRSFGAKEDLA
ncbi:FAD-binding oxidoreductase [bacterium]|nr:FAD-binding oxidoreductase [bacterium]